MKFEVFYVGIAKEKDAEFTVETCPILREEDDCYITESNRKFAISDLDIPVHKYEGVLNTDFYMYYSLDKKKVEDFVQEKKNYFISKLSDQAEIMKEVLNSCSIKYIDYSNLKVLYEGLAYESQANFEITAQLVLEEDDESYCCYHEDFDKKDLEKEIGHNTCDNEYAYTSYYSFDKVLVEMYIERKKNEFIKRAKKHLEELENSKVFIGDID